MPVLPSLTQSIAIAHAKLCNCPRKALQLPTQSFATANAKLCNCPRLPSTRFCAFSATITNMNFRIRIFNFCTSNCTP